MKLEAVTLDATQTLFHSPRMAAIYAEVLARHGLRFEEGALERMVREVWQEFSCLAEPHRDRFASAPGGAPGFWRRFVERVCERLEAPSPSRFAAAELFERFGTGDAWQLYPDAAPAIAALRRRGLKLGVISNWDERLPRLLAGLGLGSSFEAVVYSQAAGVEKPHPEIFRLALARLGVEPQRALHVGDSARLDVEGAEAAGMHALRLDRADARSIELPTLAELPARLW